MPEQESIVVSSAEQLFDSKSRRSFLKLIGVGGAMVFLPSVLTKCNSSNSITGPNTGSPLVIDFSKGDIAVLQFAYALEQLEADFYTNVVANFSGSDIPAAEQTILNDIKNHEVIHRNALKAVLGASNDFSVTTTYGGLNFKNRAAVLATAKTFEDLGVAAYNGAAQYLSDVNNLLVAGKIVSVEARHASAIRDLLNPKTAGSLGFAPTAFDEAYSPAKVAASAQGYVVEMLQFKNAPATFVQGPNGNG
ncbi:MAG: ferritin-like domain-containing protein [Gemmatimonadota bacterium]|nr:ferritin-like domain-containing protein [Gemmatimonadota bacterium]